MKPKPPEPLLPPSSLAAAYLGSLIAAAARETGMALPVLKKKLGLAPFPTACGEHVPEPSVFRAKDLCRALTRLAPEIMNRFGAALRAYERGQRAEDFFDPALVSFIEGEASTSAPSERAKALRRIAFIFAESALGGSRQAPWLNPRKDPPKPLAQKRAASGKAASQICMPLTPANLAQAVAQERILHTPCLQSQWDGLSEGERKALVQATAFDLEQLGGEALIELWQGCAGLLSYKLSSRPKELPEDLTPKQLLQDVCRARGIDLAAPQPPEKALQRRAYLLMLCAPKGL